MQKQGSVHVTIEELVLEGREETIAEETIVGGRKRSSGYTRDTVDLLQKSFFAWPIYPCVTEGNHGAIGQCSRSGPPSREGQTHEQPILFVLIPQSGKAVAGILTISKRVFARGESAVGPGAGNSGECQDQQDRTATNSSNAYSFLCPSQKGSRSQECSSEGDCSKSSLHHMSQRLGPRHPPARWPEPGCALQQARTGPSRGRAPGLRARSSART